MKIPLHTKLRRNFRGKLYSFIALLSENKSVESSIDKAHVKNIVIIRPNYRIGNIIFLTPLINELHKAMPDAKIDVIVGMKLAGDILQEMPNVAKVLSIPRNLLLHPVQLYRFIKKARQTEYDVALNISAGSLSAEIVTSLVNARSKAGYHTKNFSRLTHAVERTRIYKHSGHQTLELLKLFDIALPSKQTPLDIKLTQDEIASAKVSLKNLLQLHGVTEKRPVIALFRNARFDKKIPDTWWQQWYEALKEADERIVVIDILSPDIPEKLNEDVLEYGSKDLRHLGAFFRACDLYVSADTGPLHLASASDARVLALFNKTDAAVYGTIGDKSKTIDINGRSPQEVAKVTANFLSQGRSSDL